MHWPKELKTNIRFKEPLSKHTTLNIGGPADFWVEPQDLEQLTGIICCCAKKKIPYFIIGKGSNILVSDKGFKGAVICLNSSPFTKIEVSENYLRCGAGLSLSKLINKAKMRGLGGMEFLAGIPASVAGALIMNAGNRRQNIGRLVKDVTVMDKRGGVRVLKSKHLRFGYRRSNLNSYLVLGATFGLIKRNRKVIERNIAVNLAEKRRTQDTTAKSAGCIFKNPRHRLAAGRMIEACGLKCKRRGKAQISAKHANYIINHNGAKATDVLYLMKLIQKEVKNKFAVQLEPEIVIVQ